MFRIVIVGLALVAAIAPVDPALVEAWYSTGVYPLIQRAITPVSNLVPFAVLDVLVLAAIGAAVVILVRGAKRTKPRGGRRTIPGKVITAVLRLVTASAVIYLLFLVLWGFNYRRVAMTDRLVLDRPAASSDAVLELGQLAVTQLNKLHTPAHAQGWRTSPWREHSMRRAFESVLAMLSDASPAVPGRLKSSVFGPYFRWTNVDGMVNPFGLEAIANPDLLPFEKSFVAAHEWAHLAGYADESEASFVGWLTCIRASTSAAYSGWLFLYWQINSEVSDADRKQLRTSLESGPRADVAAISERLQRGQVPLLRDAGWRVYDQYLKANRVEEGVRNYDAVISLLVRARFEKDWVPVRSKILN